VFQRSLASGTQSDVFIMGGDGSGLTGLTSTASPLSEERPVISPDGRWIAFQRFDGAQFDIWLMKTDGSAQINLTNTAAPSSEQNPDFSPDGTQITFNRSADVFVMNRDGSGQVNLTPQPEGGSDPTWAPDGQGIFFVRCGGFFSCEIWFTNADGSGQVLAADPDLAQFGLAASPDGLKLAYVVCAPGPCFDISVRDLASGAESSLHPTSGGDGDPVFSPDMKRFAFSADPSGSAAIFVMNADGANPTPLTSVPANDDDINPSWEYVYRCGKRRATIVGDDGPDTIRGTNKRDVIVANGGRDLVRGRGGNDRICLGGGKDRAVGGSGEDRCVGGKGKDKGKGCEAGKL